MESLQWCVYLIMRLSPFIKRQEHVVTHASQLDLASPCLHPRTKLQPLEDAWLLDEQLRHTKYKYPPRQPTYLLLYPREELYHVVHAVETVVELLSGVLGEVRDPQIRVAPHFSLERPQLVQDQVEQGRLPRAIGSHDSHPGFQVHPEVHIGKKRIGRVVAERNAFDLTAVPKKMEGGIMYY